MKKTKFFHVVLLALLAFSFEHVQAQEKIEIESRVKKAQVPEDALRFVDSISHTKRIKWYTEERGSDHSYEAKFKRKRRKYSVEFDTLGQLEDIEIEIKFKDLEPEFQRKVDSTIGTYSSSNSLIKIQEQITGSPKQTLVHLKGNITSKDSYVTLRYEAVVALKENSTFVHYEMLFDADGDLIKRTKIAQRSTDHLEF